MKTRKETGWPTWSKLVATWKYYKRFLTMLALIFTGLNSFTFFFTDGNPLNKYSDYDWTPIVLIGDVIITIIFLEVWLKPQKR